jgi:acetate kinase
MCAMQGRKSIATTMGFTALDGLMMGTRCGNIDPGVLLYLMEFHRMDAAGITKLLYKESGLLGVSGLSQDMRALLASKAPAAQEAVELFCYRVSRELGSLAAALGGLDALVFTAGIGEHAAPVRERVCRQAEWLGVRLDSAANERSETCISAAGSAVDVLVIPTNEEWMIARHVTELLA